MGNGTARARSFALVGWLACALIAGLFAHVASARALTTLESEDMGSLVQWAYYNGTEKDPEACEATCSALWSAEEKSHDPSVWETLADEVTLKAGLYGSISGKSVGHSLGATPSRAGIIFEGATEAQDKWVWVRQPAAASEPGACLESYGFSGGDHEWTPLDEEAGVEHPTVAGPAWFANGCSIGGNGIRRYDPGAEGSCERASVPDATTGEWLEERWQEGKCWIGLHAPTTFYEQGIYSPAQFGPMEPFEHQYFEVLFRVPPPGTPPTPAELEALLAKALKNKEFAFWIGWALGGGNGPEPDGPSGPMSQDGDEGEPGEGCKTGGAVDCASGNETISQTDLAVGGRGPGLSVTRTYNSLAAVSAGSAGAFGYGWAAPYGAHIEENPTTKVCTVTTNSGTQFIFDYIEGAWAPAGAGVQSKLHKEGEAFVFTQPDQTQLRFGAEGHLTSIVDRNGNTVTMHWSGGQLESVSDGASRSISFKYEGGRIVEAKDPMGHVVRYGYNEAKTELTSVTEPGEAGPNWSFAYNGEHELTSQTDGREHTTTREYDSSHRVISETDPMGRKRTWEYSAPFGSEGETTTIVEPNGSTTREVFNIYGEPTEVTRAYGTAIASTTAMPTTAKPR